jgi:hypothetical protein
MLCEVIEKLIRPPRPRISFLVLFVYFNLVMLHGHHSKALVFLIMKGGYVSFCIPAGGGSIGSMKEHASQPSTVNGNQNGIINFSRIIRSN